MTVTRRRFLGMSSGLLASAFLSGCMSMEQGGSEPKDVEVPAGQVPVQGNPPLHNQPERFFLIHNDDGLLAFSTRCTHQSCNVGWEADNDRFHCPCHGSTFDRNGVEQGGPAPRPLDLFPLSVRGDGSVVVTTGPTTRREEYEPGQAVPLT